MLPVSWDSLQAGTGESGYLHGRIKSLTGVHRAGGASVECLAAQE
jgi:hypothetical protein